MYRDFSSPLVRVLLSVFFALTSAFAALPVAAQSADLSVDIQLPISVIYGHHPVNIVVSVTNNSQIEQTFDGTITHGGPAWGLEDYPYSFTPNSQVYNINGGNDTITHYWRGTILPQASAEFTLPTFSGIVTGTYQFVSISINGIQVNRNITVTGDSRPAHGQFNFNSSYGAVIPGGYTGLELTLESPELVQFQAAGPVTSNCGIQYLPAGFTGHPQRSYEHYTWTAKLPEQFTNPTCTISVDVYQLPGYDRKFTVSTTLNLRPSYMVYLPYLAN